MDKKTQVKKEEKPKKDNEFSMKDAISFAKSLQTEKIQFTEKEKKQITSALVQSFSK